MHNQSGVTQSCAWSELIRDAVAKLILRKEYLFLPAVSDHLISNDFLPNTLHIRISARSF